MNPTTDLTAAVLQRLHYLNDWRGENDIAHSVTQNCPGFAGVALNRSFHQEVNAALAELVGQGVVAKKVGEDARWEFRYMDADRQRQNRVLEAMAELLKGTPAGADLLAILAQREAKP